MESDGLDQESIVAAVPEWVPEVRFFAETQSTNRDAAHWAAGGAPEGCLVVADFQTAGRGRLDRSWFAPTGSSLLFSVILRPQMPAEQWGLINLAAGVALCEALSDDGVTPAIKWPNDVTLSGRKAAGILSQSGDGFVALGIGVNVNVPDFPGDIAALATSLLLEQGRKVDRLSLLVGFLGRFHPLYSDLAGKVPGEFRRWCLTLGSPVRVTLPGRTIDGKAVDIDSTGALILDSGEVISAGDVVHLRSEE